MTDVVAGACDTHVHVYDHRYPTSSTTVLRPPDATLTEYAAVQRALGLDRVVLVQPTTYGLDNRLQLHAVGTLGVSARAVVVVDDQMSDDELGRLTGAGARGARFHMLPGGAVPWAMMQDVAERIAAHGWHIQLQLDGRELPDRLDDLLKLPTPLVIDHVGRFMPPVTPDHDAFRALLTLVDTGRCWVKLSAPYESTHDGAPDYPSVAELARRLVERAPERMLWATNWPHPGQGHPLDAIQLRSLLVDWLPDPVTRRRVLVDNPTEVYGFDPIDVQPHGSTGHRHGRHESHRHEHHQHEQDQHEHHQMQHPQEPS